MAKNKPISNRPLWIAIIAVAFVAVVALALASKATLEQQKREDPSIIRSLIITAVGNLNRPVASDARTGTYYLREQRLALPGQYEKIGLTFRYDETDKTYNLSSSELFNQNTARLTRGQTTSDVMKEVPHLQACQRGVQLRQTATTLDSLTDAGQKQLADGRTVHFYVETECQADLEPVLASLKTVESY